MIDFFALVVAMFLGVNSHASFAQAGPSYVGKWLVTYQWASSQEEECEWDDESDEWICEQPNSSPGQFELIVTEKTYCAGSMPSNCHEHSWIEGSNGTQLSFALAPAIYTGVLKDDRATGTFDTGTRQGAWSAARL